MAYILSDDSVKLIKEIQKDDKNHFKITNKNELLEFAMGVSFLTMGFQVLKGKNKLSPEDETKLGKLKTLMDELKEHKDDIDYEDLNRRLQD